jgi:DNA-directed RNA polymerase subunit H (RpoH/RPB5)
MKNKNIEEILKEMKELSEEFFEKTEELVNKEPIENVCKKLELEDHNFKVNSDGWVGKTSNDIEYLENKEGDIVEIINHPDLSGEQLFTWDAAMRETKKAGKRMPTDKEFDIIFKDDDKDVVKNIKYCGFRFTDGTSYAVGPLTHFWSSSIGTSTTAWFRYLFHVDSGVYRYSLDRAFGFSVRCIK